MFPLTNGTGCKFPHFITRRRHNVSQNLIPRKETSANRQFTLENDCKTKRCVSQYRVRLVCVFRIVYINGCGGSLVIQYFVNIEWWINIQAII